MVITIFRTDWNDQSRQAIERCDFEEEEDVPLLKVDDENQVAAVPPPTAQSLNEDSDQPLLSVSSKTNFSGMTPGQLYRRRTLQIGFMALFLVAGVVLRLVLGHEDPLCYPLPDVGNSSSVCGGNNSMFASSNCSIECDTGFASTGDLVCNASAILSYVPRCLMLAE
eukprot:m.528227 g.528227  ORF g.528227 m.528227 type:complete len:167 (+) comp57559_c0_seq86:89-589(+)